MNLTFDQLRKTNITRCEEIFHPLVSWGPTDLATAMAGEAGKACNVAKKIRRLQKNPIVLPINDPEYQDLVIALGTELADTVIYTDLFAARMGLNLGQCVIAKFNADSTKHGSENFLESPRVPAGYLLYRMDDLQIVREGTLTVLLKRYWLVTPDNFTVFSAVPFAPVCHTSKKIMETYLLKFPNFHVEFVEVAYLPKKKTVLKNDSRTVLPVWLN